MPFLTSNSRSPNSVDCCSMRSCCDSALVGAIASEGSPKSHSIQPSQFKSARPSQDAAVGAIIEPQLEAGMDSQIEGTHAVMITGGCFESNLGLNSDKPA